MKFQLNPRAKPFLPTAKAKKMLQHRRGKREEREAPVRKHQTQLGRVRWASRRGVGELNRLHDTEISGANVGIGGHNICMSSRSRTGLARILQGRVEADWLM